jgi:uncharacterized protein YkwD
MKLARLDVIAQCFVVLSALSPLVLAQAPSNAIQTGSSLQAPRDNVPRKPGSAGTDSASPGAGSSVDPSAESASADSDSAVLAAELGISGHTLRDVEALETQCFAEVNLQRKAEGLRPLVISGQLLKVARGYSRRMAKEGFFSHSDPEGETVFQRVDGAGLRWGALGENLALSGGYVNPVATSVQGWMNSPGHRKNILNSRFDSGAVGVWIDPRGTVFFTQIFMAK